MAKGNLQRTSAAHGANNNVAFRGSAPSNYPGIDSDSSDPEVWAKQINASHLRTVESILGLAEICREADQKILPKRKAEFYAKLNMSAATFSKLVKIGGCKALQRKDIRQYLPPSMSTIYVALGMSEKELTQAVANKTLTARTTRKEADVLVLQAKSARSSKEEPHDAKKNANNGGRSISVDRQSQHVQIVGDGRSSRQSGFCYNVELRSNISVPERAEFEKWLEAGRKLPAVKHIRPV